MQVTLDQNTLYACTKSSTILQISRYVTHTHTHITSKSPELSFNQNDKAMNENGEAFSFAIARIDGNDHLLISVYSRLLCFPGKVLSNY